MEIDDEKKPDSKFVSICGVTLRTCSRRPRTEEGFTKSKRLVAVETTQTNLRAVALALSEVFFCVCVWFFFAQNILTSKFFHSSSFLSHSVTIFFFFAQTILRVLGASLFFLSFLIFQNRPVLLEGPSGCGKSSILDEVALLTRQVDMVRIHLDDQVDSKVKITFVPIVNAHTASSSSCSPKNSFHRRNSVKFYFIF